MSDTPRADALRKKYGDRQASMLEPYEYELDLALREVEREVAELREARPIMAEVARAVAKFPTWPTDPLHALAVLGEEFGELTKAMVQLTYEPHKTSADEVRTEALQTAAMALRLYHSLGKYDYRPSPQHEQAALKGKESADPQYLPAHPDADRVLNRKPAASAPCDHKWDCSCTTEDAPRMSEQNRRQAVSDATLLPCPFCGGTPVGIEHPPHKHVFATFMPDHPGSYTIECPSCNVGMIDSTEDACVAAWNARTAEREVARLREANEALWKHCRVVFYHPYDSMAYPIEHAPHADKDCRLLIEAELEKILKGKP